jgi:hypothetical protein
MIFYLAFSENVFAEFIVSHPLPLVNGHAQVMSEESAAGRENRGKRAFFGKNSVIFRKNDEKY